MLSEPLQWRLESLPGWSWGTLLPDKWVQHYMSLQDWMARHDDRTPRTRPAGRSKRALSAAEKEEQALGRWVDKQRSSERGGKERLDAVYECVNGRRASRAALLEALPGWL